MRIIETKLDGVLIIEPDVFKDARGYFLETYNNTRYKEHGIRADFVQDNMSFSRKAALQGLHYQHPNGQDKLVQVLQGEVFDVAVDIRKGSPTFGKWVGAVISADNKKQIFVPQSFAHGFCVLSETALFHYKCSDYYAPNSEYGVLWSDPDLGIEWPIEETIVSEKDAKLPRLIDIPAGKLPSYE